MGSRFLHLLDIWSWSGRTHTNFLGPRADPTRVDQMLTHIWPYSTRSPPDVFGFPQNEQTGADGVAQNMVTQKWPECHGRHLLPFWWRLLGTGHQKLLVWSGLIAMVTISNFGSGGSDHFLFPISFLLTILNLPTILLPVTVCCSTMQQQYKNVKIKKKINEQRNQKVVD